MDANALLRKLGQGKGKKQKGLPKRHRNPNKKLRAQRNRDRLQEKKVRHVLRRNGLAAAVKYMDAGFVGVSVLRKVCHSRGIPPPV